jgi:hypothetical protein
MTTEKSKIMIKFSGQFSMDTADWLLRRNFYCRPIENMCLEVDAVGEMCLKNSGFAFTYPAQERQIGLAG